MADAGTIIKHKKESSFKGLSFFKIKMYKSIFPRVLEQFLLFFPAEAF